MKYKRDDAFQLKSVAGDYVLIARGSAAIDFSSVILFNETGVFIWPHLDQLRTAKELAEMMISEFGAPEGAAEEDVQRFLDKMQAEGIIHAEGD